MILSNLSDNIRIPIIPLPIEYEDLKTTGEIMIDFNKKRIMVVDSVNPDIVHDISEWVAENIDNINGDTIIINIDGTGETTLKEIIEKLFTTIDESTIEAVDVPGLSFYAGESDIDNITLAPTGSNGHLEIKGFFSAKNGTLPVKIAGEIKWLSPNELEFKGSGGGSTNTGNDSDSSIDMSYGNVYELSPVDVVLYPIISERQISNNLKGSYDLILPKSEFSYIKIEWIIKVGDEQLTLNYNNNIAFNVDNYTTFKPNTTYKLVFVSMTKGFDWICEIQEFPNKYLGG